MVFKVTFEGKALVNHTLKTETATNDGHCESKCFMDDRCISYSFDERLRICNLSDSDHIMHPEHLVDTPNAIYRSAEVLQYIYMLWCMVVGWGENNMPNPEKSLNQWEKLNHNIYINDVTRSVCNMCFFNTVYFGSSPEAINSSNDNGN